MGQGLSFPPDSEFYYHFIVVPVRGLGSDPNLTFEILQRREIRTVTVSNTTSENDVKLQVVTTEFGGTVGVTAEVSGSIELISGKLSENVSIAAKRAATESESIGTGNSATESTTYTLKVPIRRLLVRLNDRSLNEFKLNDE